MSDVEVTKSKIPPQCIGCTKRDMDAAYCPVQTDLSDETFPLVQCSNVGLATNRLKYSGGKFNRKRNKDKPGIHKGSFMQVGAKIKR